MEIFFLAQGTLRYQFVKVLGMGWMVRDIYIVLEYSRMFIELTRTDRHAGKPRYIGMHSRGFYILTESEKHGEPRNQVPEEGIQK